MPTYPSMETFITDVEHVELLSPQSAMDAPPLRPTDDLQTTANTTQTSNPAPCETTNSNENQPTATHQPEIQQPPPTAPPGLNVQHDQPQQQSRASSSTTP